MSFLGIVFISLYLIAPLVLIAGFFIGLFLYNGLAKRLPDWFPGALIVALIGLGLILIPILLDRNIIVFNENTGAQLGGSRTMVDVWVTRIMTMGLLLVAVGEILRNLKTKVLSGGEKTLWLAYVGFILMSGLVPAILGTRPTFMHSMIYAPLILTALYMSKGYSPDQFLKHVRIVIGVILALSLLAAVLRPALAIEQPYSGFLPGINFRLWGVVGHANALGPISVLYLILLIREHALGYRLILHVSLGLLTLILAQSKTAWISALVIFGFLFLRYYLSKLGGAFSGQTKNASVTTAAIGLVSVVLFSIAFLVAYVFFDPVSWINNLLSAKEVESLSTLTGRINIWQLTLAEWEKSPIFGYGPGLWDVQYRMEKGLLYAGQAHNQFVQTLGESGTFGFLGLLIYIVVLLKMALRYSSATQGVSLALFLLLMVRTVSETPFRNYYVLEAAFLMHITLFGYLILLAKQDAYLNKGVPVLNGRMQALGAA